MVLFEYRTKEEARKVFDHIKENIKRNMISGYFVHDNYYEKEENLIYFTLEYDEEEKRYELFYCNDKVYITPQDENWDYKDIAFIMYPISELMLEI